MVTKTTQGNAPLLAKLIGKQGSLSDYKFASILEIERSLWTMTRNGNRNISITLLKAIVQNYPELIPDVIEFLRNSHEQT